MKKGSVDAQYDEKYIKSQRSFPVGATILLVLVLAVQITLVTVGIVFQPKPQDLIHQYDVIVEPLGDGSLDIEYSLVWEALDTTEALTWVDIGMANGDFSVYDYSVSNNLSEYRKHVDGDSIPLRLYFEDA